MTLALIAFAVAMDVTAVSAGYALRKISLADLTRLAVTFGLFQCGMALIGAFGGEALSRFVSGWDHWIAFGLLAAVGGHMIWEAFEDDDESDDVNVKIVGLATLLVLGIATSIDSLAVGATLPTLGLPTLVSATVIGIVSFAMAYIGAWAGRKIGQRFGSSVEILGGVVLIGIGIHTVVERYLP